MIIRGVLIEMDGVLAFSCLRRSSDYFGFVRHEVKAPIRMPRRLATRAAMPKKNE